jgi:hypothetical protein
VPQPKKYASHAKRQAAYEKRRKEARLKQLQEMGLPALPVLPTIPGMARWRKAIANAQELLALVEREMESYYDERSETWQDSERGDEFRNRLDTVRDARSNLDDLSID